MSQNPLPPSKTHDIIIIGGGAGGIATAASILNRRKEADIAIIEPQTEHYYQPGWTMVGGGIFDQKTTMRKTANLMPAGVRWVQSPCKSFEPEHNQITLEDGTTLGYKILITAPGLKLDWEAVEGLQETLGRNGVTSNYHYDMAPYTWELVSGFRGGNALFTQPPMPIKCAGAPQKAMYLACDDWKKRGVLNDTKVSFHNAGGVLFGVKEYVPALMEYVHAYGINLQYNENLIKIDGEARQATFAVTGENGDVSNEVRDFDMIHICPPQTALDFIKQSPLANDAGWVDVHKETLQHNRFENIFGLGDAGSTPNAKTAAAVRKQAPVAAVNALRVLDGLAPHATYNGYGSCPLTVERGKIVLAEFAYDGKLDPTFPSWMLTGTKPTKRAWFLKEKMLPSIYFEMMLKGGETFAKPTIAS